ncbi:MAG: hypothetical protein DDT23_01331 [candidate division WS2 bacterium]|nr:hypothetical protein [Candidatus Lithacetigena glycinireducens]
MKVWTPKDIKVLRKVNRLSQRALSELLGVTENYVYLLEKGVREPSNTLRLLLDCVEERLSKEKGKEVMKHGKRNL